MTMVEYLRAALEGDQHRTLVAKGHHPRVVDAKADKAARKGYIDCGVSPRFGWITTKGREFLATHDE